MTWYIHVYSSQCTKFNLKISNVYFLVMLTTMPRNHNSRTSFLRKTVKLKIEALKCLQNQLTVQSILTVSPWPVYPLTLVASSSPWFLCACVVSLSGALSFLPQGSYGSHRTRSSEGTELGMSPAGISTKSYMSVFSISRKHDYPIFMKLFRFS